MRVAALEVLKAKPLMRRLAQGLRKAGSAGCGCAEETARKLDVIAGRAVKEGKKQKVTFLMTWCLCTWLACPGQLPALNPRMCILRMDVQSFCRMACRVAKWKDPNRFKLLGLPKDYSVTMCN